MNPNLPIFSRAYAGRTTGKRGAIVRTAALVLLLGCGGCYVTAYSLESDAKASISTAYVGKFAGHSGDSDYTMTVRNADNKHYLVKWTRYDGDKSTILALAGYMVTVKGATFAQLRALDEKGTIAERHLLLRTSISEDKRTITLQHLNESFFEKVDSDAALRALIEQNLDKSSMYLSPLTLSRVKDDASVIP